MTPLYNNNIPVDAWHEFLTQNPHASPFQTVEFYNLFNSIPGLSAEAIAICQENIILALAIVTLQKESGIKKYFSCRGIIYGGPLINPKFPESLNLLLTEINLLISEKAIYIETRNYSDYNEFHQNFINNKWEYIPYINFTINLRERKLEDILAGMRYNRRREIKLSLESGAIYRECETEMELKDIYDILSDLYKRQVKLPLLNYFFFKAIWQTKSGKVFIVTHNNIIIGGCFCMIQPKTAIYTMYYCGLRNYHKKIFPTHLAILAAIEYGVNNGLQYLDFMGAGKKEEEYGVRKYKKEFGGEINEYGRYRFITKPFMFILGLTGLKLWKKLNK